MSNLYSRPLSVLREINLLLREDLRDLDLVGLRAETISSPGDPHTIAKWTQLLNMLSPSMVLLGKEFDNVVDRSKKLKDEQLQMIGIIYVFLSLLKYTIIIILIFRIREEQHIASKINMVILIILVYLIFVFVRKSIIIMLQEGIRMICIAQQGVIHNALRYYKNELSDNYIVKQAAAKITGTGDSTTYLVTDPKTGISIDIDKPSKDSSCNASNASKTLPSVFEIVSKTCSPDRIKLLDTIQQIKLEFERFDQYASWMTIKNMYGNLTEFFKKEGVGKLVNGANITAIVQDEFASHFVPAMIELDMMIIAPELVQPIHTNFVLLRKKLEPYLISKENCESKAHAMRRASFDPTCAMCVFIRTHEDTNTPEGELYKLKALTPLEEFFIVTYDTIDVGARVSVAIGKSIDSDPVRSGNLFVRGHVPAAYISDNTKYIQAGFQNFISVGSYLNGCRNEDSCNFIITDGTVSSKYSWKDDEDTGDAIREEQRTIDYIMNLFMTKSDATGSNVVYAKFTVDDLYKYALLSNNALRMLHDAREILSVSLLDVTKKYEFQIDLQSQRKTIELYLAKIYGSSFDSLRPAVMLIIRDTNKKVQIALQSNLLQYASEHALIKKSIGITEIEWNKRLRSIVNVIPKMREYRVNFPKYNPVAGKKIIDEFLLYFVVIMVLMIVLGFSTIITLFLNNVISTLVDGIIAVILLSCLCVIIIIILENLVLRIKAVSDRKRVLLDANGSELIMAVLRCVTSLVDMRKNATSLVRSDMDRSKTDALLSIKYYHKSSEFFAKCNFIDVHTNTISIKSKLIIFIVLILFVVVVSLYVLNKLDPLGCYDNIKRIKSIIGLINSGDIDKTMFAEAFTSSTCLIPPTPPIWFLKIFATILILMGTTWFLAVNNSTNDDLINTLERMNDCREIDAYT
jgi:hypothetical protein